MVPREVPTEVGSRRYPGGPAPGSTLDPGWPWMALVVPWTLDGPGSTLAGPGSTQGTLAGPGSTQGTQEASW